MRRCIPIKMKLSNQPYNFEYANVEKMFELFRFRSRSSRLMEATTTSLLMNKVIKEHHSFNLLDACGAISVTERQPIFYVSVLWRSIA